jgi:hypothetical protein
MAVGPVPLLAGTEEAAASRSWKDDGTIADLTIDFAGFDGRLSTDSAPGLAVVSFTVFGPSEDWPDFIAGNIAFGDSEFLLPRLCGISTPWMGAEKAPSTPVAGAVTSDCVTVGGFTSAAELAGPDFLVSGLAFSTVAPVVSLAALQAVRCAVVMWAVSSSWGTTVLGSTGGMIVWFGATWSDCSVVPSEALSPSLAIFIEIRFFSLGSDPPGAVFAAMRLGLDKLLAATISRCHLRLNPSVKVEDCVETFLFDGIPAGLVSMVVICGVCIGRALDTWDEAL